MELPAPFISSLRNLESFEEETFLSVHASGEQVVSIRLNPSKLLNLSKLLNQSKLLNETSSPSIEFSPVPWNSKGYYLPKRPSFTLDPLFHAGAYYVQEASSMFLEEAISQSCDLTLPLKVLDLCAAPGGKSTLLLSLLNSNSLLVSNEVINSRVNVLSENITKWGYANTIVTNNDAKDFQNVPGFFDVIIVDAPCSGSGLFRKDPESIKEWSLQNVELCSQRQQIILSDILPALKPGGILIYSTCSYSEKEDEEICDWLLAEHLLHPVSLKLKQEWNIVETISSKRAGPGYRFYPNKLKGEGFYLAVFKKESDAEILRRRKPKQKLPVASKSEQEIVKLYLKSEMDFSFFKWKDVVAFPFRFSEDLEILYSELNTRKAGIKIGEVIRQELLPAHDLALSNLLISEVSSFEVDKETALKYLRRNEFKLNLNFNGWVIIRFEGLALGWVKVLPGRINNYYPKTWRILNK